ncbi:Asp-tRNA(Asn)/Glu-tRNA(Gln) amidotransferase subunit GatC [Sulfidibacter corallicola]|uniref:Aspartyl/glutamyl-tRNA(Asn/Gln) amidotransferase subunit C n=1 Tax=Sulfidibacter corallicola TaxID=2818388 RepID=A0A8A4TVY6_SULCO|nr:Asp-tRNA(Asn)/Glu-tRNA(Gln) amidotransferase subunit GatC [Sulfidibacter corallicola]QTD53660.1 Asp-tRNA(Asn)/Glu-tRNA(Gln) amidotransferase subunit GatC [Sulfidibacter corallicola]
MSDISKETVAHYAKLANLQFDDSEAELLARQLGSILDHVAKIGELDLEGVPATSSILHDATAFREDEPRASLGTQAALQNAPDTESDHFLVPKVIQVK